MLAILVSDHCMLFGLASVMVMRSLFLIPVKIILNYFDVAIINLATVACSGLKTCCRFIPTNETSMSGKGDGNCEKCHRCFSSSRVTRCSSCNGAEWGRRSKSTSSERPGCFRTTQSWRRRTSHFRNWCPHSSRARLVQTSTVCTLIASYLCVIVV